MRDAVAGLALGSRSHPPAVDALVQQCEILAAGRPRDERKARKMETKNPLFRSLSDRLAPSDAGGHHVL